MHFAHLEPRSQCLYIVFYGKEPGLLGEMVDSRVGPGKPISTWNKKLYQKIRKSSKNDGVIVSQKHPL